MSERWHVVQTLGGSERMADDQLRKNKHVTFLPLLERRRLLRQRSTVTHRAYYPTYLFVRFNPKDLSWGSILHLPGVFTIIGMSRPSGRPTRMADALGANWMPYSGQPRPVPEGVVERLQEVMAQHGGVFPEDIDPEDPPLAPGTPVLVDIRGGGVLRGLVDAQVGTRVRVLLDLLGRSNPTIVSRDSVSLAAQ